MGEAKRRGTFEERKMVAIKRNAEIEGITKIRSIALFKEQKKERDFRWKSNCISSIKM